MCLGLVNSPSVQSAVPYEAEFISDIRHIVGAANIVVDSLSRPPAHVAVKLVGAEAEVQLLPRSPSARWLHAAGQ